jgi:PAS domain S-box-containing protein
MLKEERHRRDKVPPIKALSAAQLLQSHRLLADASPTVLWTATPDGVLDFIRPRAFQPSPDLTHAATRWTEIAHPDDAAKTAQAWRHSIETGGEFSVQHRLKLSGDAYSSVLSRAKAVSDNDGSIRGWIGVSVETGTAASEDTLPLKAEARYRALVSAASAIVYECSADGQFITPQPSWQKYTGQSWEDHQGYGWCEMIHPEDRTTAQAALSESVKTDSPYRADVRLWCDPANKYHHCRISAAGTRDEQGSVYEWVGMIADVEETVRHAKRLHEDQNRLALSIEAAEIGTFHCPVPLNDIVWNDRCKEHFWIGPEEQISFERFYSIIHPDDRRRASDAVLVAVSEGSPYDIEYRTVSPTGKIRWLRAKGSTFADASGQPVRFDGITIDISAQKDLERERDRLLERERLEKAAAQTANRLKDSFLATVSHELRTPLNAMQTWIYYLRNSQQDTAMFLRALESIERNLRLQSKLVDDLLDISRVTSGKLFLETEAVNVKDIVDSAITDVNAMVVAKGIAITAPAECDALVQADALRLRQVIVNILDNAVKHSSFGGLVEVSINASSTQVSVSFTDHGSGIPPDFMGRLFEPFTQADDAVGRRYEGLGIGLAISKSIIDLHGGSIVALSEGIGLGAEFVVTLPRFRQGEQVGDACPGAVPAVRNPEAARLQGVKILVVEDNLDALDALGAVFETEGALVSQADCAGAARRLLASQEFDVITSDIGMPGEDGYSLMSWIRRERIVTPSVAITAFTRPEDEARAFHSGFDRYHPKPIHPSVLLDLIKSLLPSNGPEPASK